jgi:hypothetical protein
MACKELFLAFAIVAPATAGLASQMPREGAPPAPESALYCLRIEAVTGTRLEEVKCLTRQQWAELEVNVDAEWSAEGVRVIG